MIRIFLFTFMLCLLSGPLYAHEDEYPELGVRYATSRAVYDEIFIRNWSSLYFQEIFQLSHDKLENQLLDAYKYFTDDGYDDYIERMTQSNIVKEIRGKNLTLKTLPKRAPIVKRLWNLKDPVGWDVKMVLLINYHADRLVRVGSYELNVRLVRTRQEHGYRGLAIDSLEFKPLESKAIP